jgi:hypothetical protein
VYPCLGVLDATCTASLAVKNSTSPPTVWKVRLNPSPSCCHDSAGVVWPFGRADEPDGGGDADESGGTKGATRRSCTADRGTVRVGAAAASTDLMPSQAILTVTVAATAQARR